jgi:hypothetical protein
MPSEKKSYKIVHSSVKLPEDYKGGRFMSDSPTAAAPKAVKSIFQQAAKMKGKGKAAKTQTVKFTIQETTRGSAHKEFSYVGEKVKLAKPKIMVRGGVEIKIEYSYKATAA